MAAWRIEFYEDEDGEAPCRTWIEEDPALEGCAPPSIAPAASPRPSDRGNA